MADSVTTGFHPHPLRDRLWLAGFGVALLLAVMAAGLYVAHPQHPAFQNLPGEDLVPSYMAGTFVREGHPEKLMDYGAAAKFQAELRKRERLDRHGRTGPWLNPPFFALLFAPLSAMPYRAALATWFAFNVGCLAASVMLLRRMLPAAGTHATWRTWGLIPLLLLASMPLVIAMACQQNTFLSLLLLAATVTFWRRGDALLAGLVAGLLLFKPQLAVLIAAALVVTLGRRALLGIAITGCTLLAVTLLAMPGALADYLTKLDSVMPWLRAGQYYAWERQVTLHGLWRLAFQGSTSGPGPLEATVLWIACAVAFAGLVAWAPWRAVRSGAASRSPDRVIAAAVAAMPLLMPYYMDYDLLLLAVPAVLFAADVCRRGTMDRLDRAIVAAWMVLYPCLYFSAAIGAATRLNPTVPLLAALAGMLAVRVAHPLAPVLRGEGGGEGLAPGRGEEEPTRPSREPLTLTLSPAYRGEGTCA